MAESKIEKIHALLKSIETGDPGPVAVVDEAKYIQHNPQTHEGSEGLVLLFKRLSKTNPTVNMVRGFEDGDFVFAHMEYDFAGRKVCFEVFRFENARAVEHWDNIQERAGPNASGRSMVDGSARAVDRHLTEINRSLAREFVERVLIKGQLDRLADYVDADSYAEHNPRLSDGIASLRSALEASGNGNPHIDYHRLHRVLAEGNFVLCVSEGELDGAHSAFFDLFRIEDGKICEHWDTTEKIAPSSEWKNENGKF